MSERHELLLRYLRQQAELGGGRIFLDSMTARQVLGATRAAAASGDPAQSAATRDPVPPPATGGAGAALKPQPSSAGRIMETLVTLERERSAPALVASAAAASVPARAVPGGSHAGGLQSLREVAAACTRCRLHETRSTVVFGEGSETADLVVVGEAPGQEEDRTGRPFVGRAGRLLDLLLMSVGLPRDQVYICNVLKCRPPDNRNPRPDEVDPCTTHLLHAQLEQIAPRVLLAVGKFAAQVLANSEASIGRLRGRVFAYRGTPLVVTYHPAYLLRSPQMTRVAWEDFQLARRVLNEATRG
ncbi:MAG TPA: uracil-DNA glycosylase [Longimicrobiales bacterium]|nr:uracil-DNA glycosylase [Longimicrobiales bacterium]